MNEQIKIFITDENGIQRETEVLKRFTLIEFGKEYAIYTLNEIDANDMVKIYISALSGVDPSYRLEKIVTEEEWTAVKEYIKNLARD